MSNAFSDRGDNVSDSAENVLEKRNRFIEENTARQRDSSHVGVGENVDVGNASCF